MSNIALNSYKYENEINFSINEVKEAIKAILKANPTRFIHEDKDLNDAFGTYKFGEIKCSYMVSLAKVDDNNTKITITCSERTGGFNPSMASLESYTSEFINILSAKLSGKSDEEMKEVVSENNSDSALANASCLGTLLTLVGIGIAIAMIFI